jgi:hypothetical protein
MSRRLSFLRRSRSHRALLVVVAGVALACQTSAALAAQPTVPSGFTITKLATSPPGIGNCDDLAFLEGHLFVGCQNKTLSNGGGGDSSLTEFTPSGSVVNNWSIKDKIDGLAADPLTHLVIVSLNEDANTHLATINPASRQVTYYTYSPDPRGATAPVALRTGGGTDQVSVDSTGHILSTASHAGTSTGTAVFKVTLTPPSSPTGTGTAALAPTFLDDATAANGNAGSGTVHLKLGDVDSGAIVPQDSPRFGGSYVVTDQTALELVFANNIFDGTGLTVLKTPFGLDDMQWATSSGGTLYVVDKGNPNVALPKVPTSTVYKVTGPFAKNTVLASNDSVPDQVVTVNLTNGKLTPFTRGLQTSKGLVYLDASGTQTALALNGSASAPTGKTTTTKKSSSGLSTGWIIVIIVGGLALLGGGGYWLTRRRAGA